jgi:hypothetical protein
MHRFRELTLSVLGITTLFLVLGMSSVGAVSAMISSSYNATSKIPSGSIVSVEPGRSNFVQLASISNSQHLLGIVVTGNQSLLEINASSNTVQVATEGTANVLVSTVNGPISIGDQIAISPFNGVGMKANSTSRVVGIAETNFSATAPNATPEKIPAINGQIDTVYVGYVRLNIVIGPTDGSAASLSGLQGLGYTLVGRSISTFRIILCLIVAVIAIVSMVVLIYASIYGSIISIGRNPLAKKLVLRTLASVFGMVVLIAAVSGLLIVLLLS